MRKQRTNRATKFRLLGASQVAGARRNFKKPSQVIPQQIISRSFFPSPHMSLNETIYVKSDSMHSNSPHININSLRSSYIAAVPENPISTKFPHSNSAEVIETGISGLQNLGNTCYINCILQSFMRTPQLIADYFVHKPIIMQELNQKSRFQGQLAVKLSDLANEIMLGNKPKLNPFEIKRIVSNVHRQFLGYNQQDASEFFKYFIEALHEDLNRMEGNQQYQQLESKYSDGITKVANTWWNYFQSRDDSIITDYFQGQLVTQTMCKKCKHVNLASEPFTSLSLQIPERYGLLGANLYQCLKEFCKQTIVEGYRCEKCRKTQIWRFPKILVIHFKRFTHQNNRVFKNENSVKFPINGLSLDTFGQLSTDPSKELAEYNLYATVNHIGNLSYGHYTAQVLIRNCLISGSWYSLNDEIVTPIKMSEKNSSTYLLFYYRTDVNLVNNLKW